jgi:hypothetical protein
MIIRLPVPILSLSDGGLVTADVTLGGSYTLQAGFGPYEFEVAGQDYFHSLCLLREQLEVLDYRPVCFGAARDVFALGGAGELSSGLQAYRLTMGRSAAADDLVGIFDRDYRVEPVSVVEQRRHYDAWLRSLKGQGQPVVGEEVSEAGEAKSR